MEHDIKLIQSTEEETGVQSPHADKIVVEMIFRRNDMHMILDTLRLIDSISVPLKVVEHRFLLNSFSMGYQDSYFEDEGMSSDPDSDSSESSGFSSNSGGSRQRTLVQTVSRLFSVRYDNASDYDDYDDYELGRRGENGDLGGDSDFDDAGLLLGKRRRPKRVSRLCIGLRPATRSATQCLASAVALIQQTLGALTASQQRRELMCVVGLILVTLILVIILVQGTLGA